MTIRNLDHLFKPRSVALIGSKRVDPRLTRKDTISIARLLIRNLLDGGFKGPIMPVLSGLEALEGVLTYPSIGKLPLIPELAVIGAPLEETPEIIDELGRMGTRAAVLVNPGDETPRKPERKQLKQAVLDAAKPWTLRVLGPGCLGLTIPGQGLNASLSHLKPLPGRVAFLTQSGGVARAALDWATTHNVGFSHLISLGAAIDVDFGDTLDYLAGSNDSRTILLYLERVRDARKFMSAARRAARIKPVVVLKPQHGSRVRDQDAVYEAAFRRAGFVQVRDLAELFNSAETLTGTTLVRGHRLAIVGNSRSLGLLANEALINLGGEPAIFSPETETVLETLIDPLGYLCNPLDLGDLATPAAYEQAISALLRDPGVDGVLVLNSPTYISDNGAIAEAVVRGKGGTRRALVAAWEGPESGAKARQCLLEAGIPTYQDPGAAVRSFMRLVAYRRNQELLSQTPASIPQAFTPDRETARVILRSALQAGRERLNEFEALQLLRAYAIPTVETRMADTPEEAAAVAESLPGDTALKIVSPDIGQKSDVGGVALDLEQPEQVEMEARAMIARLAERYPEARVQGFVLQPMEYREGAFEITMGIRPGDNFGPVIRFGHGGTESGEIADIAWGLPPLNMALAREIMLQTRLFPRLQADTMRQIDTDILALTLIKLSQMVIDLPELEELQINPLWAGTRGVLALDAKVRVSDANQSQKQQLAIRAYPKELEETITLSDGRELLFRPILPEDETPMRIAATEVPPEYLRMRFFQPIRELSHSMAVPLTQIDYDREMALVLSDPGIPGKARLWGGVRAMADPDGDRAEYSVIIHPDMAGLGVGAMLMRKIIDYARRQGIRELWGEVLRENRPMLRLNRALGFTVKSLPEDPSIMHVSLDLTTQDESTSG